jgi:protein-tyrosine-phosphatase
MAQALARLRFGESVHIMSAGLRPQPADVATNAIETLKTEFGLDASNHVPRNVRDFNFDDFDYVIAMDKHIAKQLKEIQPPKLIVWQIDDPYGDELFVYRGCALEINRRVASLPVAAPENK